MKKFFYTIVALVALTFGLAHAQSDDKIIVATGDPKTSTYAQMFGQLNAVCGKGQWVEKATSGGIENQDLLTGNVVNAAILQTDMLEFQRRTDPNRVANIKTLVALHPEELHFIARADVKKEGGYLNGLVGAKDVTFNSLADLKGRNVGAVGGSIASGSVVAANSGLGFKVLPVNDTATLQKKLLSGELDAILVVGGAPHPMVKTLPAQFKILPIPKDLVAKLVASKLYSDRLVSYPNLNAAGVQTVATQALLVSRVYRSQEMMAKLKDFRSCFEQRLGTIQDKRGTHEKWQAVDAANHGGWPWYDLN